jgi:hypothetical protein
MSRVAAACAVSMAAVLAGAPAAAAAWTWPVRGDVVTGYANAGGPYAAGQHRGIDVAAATGTPVVAAVGGTVRFAGVVGSSGLTVSVRTADGRFDTSYLHLETAAVRSGRAVAAGARVGTVGTSGRRSSGAPHLHFGVRLAGSRRYRDPLDFLPPRPGVRDAPRGVPVAAPAPIRVAPEPVRTPRLGPAPQPAPVPAFAPRPAPVLHPASARRPAGSRLGWAVACLALIAAAALLGGSARSGARRGSRSSIGARALLRHHADLLRQR